MNSTFEIILRIILIGAGATAVMDLWGLIRKRWLGTPALNYCLLGRWIGHFPRRQFVHESIQRSPQVRGECGLGWAAHYAIGIAFAAALVGVAGGEWLLHPSVLPALIVGIGTVVAPLFLMQPAMGSGFAGAKTPRPNLVRVHALITHTVFGLGLYLAGMTSAWLFALADR